MSQRPERARFADKPAERPAGSLDMILIGRLLLAAVLLIVSIFIDLKVVKIILLVLSAVAAGYDLGLKAFDSILEGDYFATPVLLLFITFVSFLIGYGIEAAAMLILYQVGLLLIAYVQKRTRASALELLNGGDQEFNERAGELYTQEDALKLDMEAHAYRSANFVLKIGLVIALLSVFLLPLLGDYSYRVSIHRGLMIALTAIPASVVAAMPYTALVGLCFGAKQGVLFRNAKAMERTAETNVAVFDKAGVFSSGDPELRSFQSEMLDERTFMSFVAHAVYYSEQAFAKAIPPLAEQDYRLDVISDFVDVPGCGVELKIGGSPVVLATKAYLTARGIQLPETEDDSDRYYLTVAGRYIGSLNITSPSSGDSAELVNGLRDIGFRQTILLTEDGAGESRRLAEELGMDDVYGECDTERKLQHIDELSQSDRNQVMFLYANGVEAHSAADVDVRFNRKAKYADLAVPMENVSALPFSILISRRMTQVAKENAIFVFAVKALMIFLSLIGYNSIWFVMFMDIAAVLATLLNAIRVTRDPLIDLNRMAEEDIQK